MEEKAFTLVELIVVIIILAILGLISFISIQGFTIDTRDAKRISDIRNLITKITIENTKGVDYSNLINKEDGYKDNKLTINSTSQSGSQNTGNSINWNVLRENGDNFKDPLTGNPYPFAFAEGNADGVGYSFIQLAYIEEKTGATKLVGNYYEMQPGDSPSLFTNDGGNGENIPNDYIIDDDIQTPPTEPSTPPTQTNNDCERNPDFNGYDIPAISDGQETGKLTRTEYNILNGKTIYTLEFKCTNGFFYEQGEEIETIDCDAGYNSNGIECIQLIPESCPEGQYLNGTNCEDVGNGNYSGDGEKEIHSCPEGGTTETTTANSVTECKKLNQACEGNPQNAVWSSNNSTTKTITQVYNETSSSYKPSLTGEYNTQTEEDKCYYKCATNFHTENSGTSCISNTATGTCTGNIPTHSTKITGDTYTRTWTTTRDKLVTTARSNGGSICGYSCNSGRTGDTCSLQIINGVCGNGGGTSAVTSAPTSSLCTSGTASAVTNSTNTWTWSCSGSNGGTNATGCNRARAYCATKPSYTNATFTTGTPTSSNQSWVKGASNCGFNCNSGYTWDSSSNTCKNIPGVSHDPGNGTITIANGNNVFVIADKNAGATRIYNNQTFSSTSVTRTSTINSWAGGLYQFGANDDRSINNFVNGNSSYTYDWKSPGGTDAGSANVWGVTDANKFTATYANSTTANRTKMKGPCDTGYHIPTTLEWRQLMELWFATKNEVCAINNNSTGYVCAWTTKATFNDFMSELKLPMAGRRLRGNGAMYDQGYTGNYWSSSPNGSYGFRVYFNSGGIYPVYNYYRAYAFSIRCFKN